MLPSEVTRDVEPCGVVSTGADCEMDVLRMEVECLEEDIMGVCVIVVA